MLEPGLAALTTLLGVLMSRTSLCTVAGVQQCLRERSAEGLRPMLAAASAAGVVLLACSLLWPAAIALPRGQPIGLALLAGAAVLGLGALVNGACYLGSVLYIGRGNLNFLLTLAGLGLASRAAAMPSPLLAAGGARMSPGVAGLLGAALFALLAFIALRRQRRALVLAAGASGLVAGAVFALHPAWSYGAVVDALARARPGALGALVPALMLFAGASLGALLQHRWRLVHFTPVPALRCLAGGLLMGWGAHLIPGGNDMLLLWAIPGLTLYGLVAYLAMAATIALLLAGAARLPRQAGGAARMRRGQIK
jgi:toxin CptA